MDDGGVYLFGDASLSDWLRDRQLHLKKLILGASEQDLLNRDVDEWGAELAERFHVERGQLVANDRYLADEGEAQIDVSGDFGRAIRDHTTPTYIAGRRVVLHVPYIGNPTLLRLRAQRFTTNPPRAVIAAGEITVAYEFPSDKRPDLKGEADRLVEQVNDHLEWQAGEIKAYNSQLKQFAEQVIGQRRERILADRQYLDDLGLPVRKRGDAPSTFAAPGIARRPSPVSTRSVPAGRQVPRPEPTLVKDFYEHILGVVRSMARAMERTPGDYASWDEEQLRDSLLVMLNTHYQGQATGETFNKEGKTDILVRVEDRNVFVGECKWWSGPAAFAGADAGDGGDRSAVDQLLGYTTWRDAKLALVMFVGNKGIDQVIARAREALSIHPAFESWTEGADEGELLARVRLPGQGDRRADLAVVFVHLPRP